ncbi:MAG: endolytic transglycosylase MltG [Bacteroidaceae bacterium]|nr:endolytic transglycosylase MltG [Bacteroidaceae bacterium]
MSKSRKILLTLALLGVCCLLALSLQVLNRCTLFAEPERYIYIRPGQTSSDVRHMLASQGVRRMMCFTLLEKTLGYKVRSGRYAIRRGDNQLALFRRLRNGQQEPLNLTLPSVRTLPRLAGFLGERLMVDSATFITAFRDSARCAQLGYTPQTLPALFIPNTYEVYWDISLDDFLLRMKRENTAFWTSERDRKAQAMGLTHEEVVTLASIVDEETANNAEKPMIAGMYLKRLSIGMPLQADPTVKFAVGDFSLRRIRGEHLKVESPYNTYRNEGLPPGPIRIPSVAGIDAVLNHVSHDYIYMCAKEDFSGTHNFARTYAEHQQNARRYVRALDERNIK